MRNITMASLKDTDIDIKRIEKRLKDIANAISNSNKKNLTDINVICEEIFCKLLNRVYNLQLEPMSANKTANYLAVDLVDEEQKVAYQITSRNDRQKINMTIEKFNNSELRDSIEELNIFILKADDHNYRGENVITLRNGKEFSYLKNVINLKKLVQDIEHKNNIKDGFLEEVYDIISMVYDTGRLYYFNTVDITSEFKEKMNFHWGENSTWRYGYGDVQLTAYIPYSYDDELSCLLETRKHNISGALITFDQGTLIEDYFVSEKEFENKHYMSRYEDEDYMFIQIGCARFYVNAHTAYHIYKLFDKLKRDYLIAMEQIEYILGATGMSKLENKYLLMSISVQQWKEILFFADQHDWKKKGDITWNIFNIYSDATTINLSLNMHGEIRGGVSATISVIPSASCDNKYDLYWQPGFNVNMGSMDGFDNIVKWRADYTKVWIKDRLLNEAHSFYIKYSEDMSWWNKFLHYMGRRSNFM